MEGTIRLVSLALLLASTCCTQSKESESDIDLDHKREEPEKDRWLEQKLDHFNILDKRMWRQRYLQSTAFYRPGGPAFLMVGGEASSKGIYTNGTNLWITLAQEIGAICFYLEHRFYGKGRPTENTSIENLRFLSSQQALEDIAHFIKYQTSKFSKKISKWILYGGSYAGSLAVWARLKFPHLVHGTVAASPPLLAKFSFHEYLGSVNQTLYAYGGSECHHSIELANKEISTLSKTAAGIEHLKDVFNMCDDSTFEGNSMPYFRSVLNNHLENVVQYSKGNILIEKPMFHVSIGQMCEVMNNESLGSYVQRFGEVIRQRREAENLAECVTSSFSRYVEFVQNTSWASKASRQWMYQVCTEFGWFQTSAGHPFQPVDQSFPVDLCTSIFGPYLTADDAQSGPSRTNLIYGGRNVAETISRVVVSNGGVDPWHMLSYSKSNIRIDSKAVREPRLQVENVNSPHFAQPDDETMTTNWEKSDFLNPDGFNSIFVPSSSHCEVMLKRTRKDSPELQNSRLAIRALVKYWLQPEQSHGK